MKLQAQQRKEAKDAANAFALRQGLRKSEAKRVPGPGSAPPTAPPPPNFDQVRKALHDHKHAEATS